MRKWREARSVADKRRLLAEAMAATGGNRTHMAKLLGLSRESVSRILAGRTTLKVGQPGSGVTNTDPTTPHGVMTPHGVTTRHSVTTPHGVTRDGGTPTPPTRGRVTTTGPEPLRTKPEGPTLPTTTTTTTTRLAMETTMAERRRRRINVQLPIDHLKWLRRRADERAGDGRPGSVGDVLQELIRAAMDAEDGDPKE